MKTRISILTLLTLIFAAGAAGSGHEMQHGFILSDSDRFASHLVADGHHSWQTSISGVLVIRDSLERQRYFELKQENTPQRKTYFLFQAQRVDLSSMRVGQVLSGHIVESKLGEYQPQNVIVREATFVIQEIHISVPNPFFL